MVIFDQSLERLALLLREKGVGLVVQPKLAEDFHTCGNGHEDEREPSNGPRYIPGNQLA